LRHPESLPAESQAVSDLFAGAIGLFKNPTSHRRLNLEDRSQAANAIRLADLLLKTLASLPHVVGPL